MNNKKLIIFSELASFRLDNSTNTYFTQNYSNYNKKFAFQLHELRRKKLINSTWI